MKYLATLLAATFLFGAVTLAYADESPQANPTPTLTAGQPADPAVPAETQSGQTAMPTVPQSEPAAAGTGQNPRLAALAPPGMSADEACAGFRSVDECAATLHAAQNLGIPFPDLKSRVTGGKNLGAAIHDLKPKAKATTEVRKAEDQARTDVHPQG